MKKILWIILAFSIILAGCYDDDGTATVRINLGNMPVAQHMQKKSLIDKVLCLFSKEAYAWHPSGIIKIHLIALQGDNKIAIKSIGIDEVTENTQNPNHETVDFEVPAGDNITIVILGERYETMTALINDIFYYGKTESPVSLAAGKVTEVLVPMTNISGATTLSITPAGNDERITWSPVPGASKYILEYQPQIGEFGVIYSGTGISFINIGGAAGASPYYRMRVEFDYIGKLSDYITTP